MNNTVFGIVIDPVFSYLKARKIIYAISGVIYLVLSLLIITGMPFPKTEETPYRIGYVIGMFIFLVPGPLLLYAAWLLHKKMRNDNRLRKFFDDFMNN